MKIMQIAPIYIPTKPDLKYGGIERVVLALGKCFNEKGHDIITAAPADSRPYGRLFPTLPISEWMKPIIEGSDPKAYEKHVRMIINYLQNERVDIIHDHTGNFVLSESFNDKKEKYPQLKEIPIVVTPHELKRFAKTSPPKQDNIIFTALSNYQKNIFSDYVNVKKVIYNGIFVEDYGVSDKKDGYIFSLGSIERDKGQDLVVRASSKTKTKLKIGGKITDREFYDVEIDPLTNGNVEYIGELNDEQKKIIYKYANASILPIRIGDCFTLTRIESLASGTPVITLNTGSAKEAIEHGKTGYVIDYDPKNEEKVIDEMVYAIKNLKNINPHTCRTEACKRFNWYKISEEYLNLYKNIQKGKI